MNSTKKDLEALKGWPFTSTDDLMKALLSSPLSPSLLENSEDVPYDNNNLLGHALILEEPNHLFTGSDSKSARKVGVLHPDRWEKVKMVHIVMPSEDQTYFGWNFHSVVHYGLRVTYITAFINVLKVIGLPHCVYTANRCASPLCCRTWFAEHQGTTPLYFLTVVFVDWITCASSHKQELEIKLPLCHQ